MNTNSQSERPPVDYDVGNRGGTAQFRHEPSGGIRSLENAIALDACSLAKGRGGLPVATGASCNMRGFTRALARRVLSGMPAPEVRKTWPVQRSCWSAARGGE